MYRYSASWILALFSIVVHVHSQTCFDPTYDSCTAQTACFWISTLGQCQALSSYVKINNQNKYDCGKRRSIDACYALTRCFWVAHSGDCEEVENYGPRTAGSGPYVYPTGGVMVPTVPGLPPAAGGVVSPGGGSIVYPTGGAQQMPVAPATPAPTRATAEPTQATSEPTQRTLEPTLATMEPTHVTREPTHATAEPTHVTKEPTLATKEPTLATKEPTLRPTQTTMEPTHAIMSLCDTYVDYTECSANEDCLWEATTQQCFFVDGTCEYFPTQASCGSNEDCVWSVATSSCGSMCTALRDPASCMNEEDCFWDPMTPACLSLTTPCNRMLGLSSCMHNEACFWSDKKAQCLSYFVPCDEMETEMICSNSANFQDRCVWGEDPFVEGLMGCQDPFTTLPPFIDCEAIAEEVECSNSVASETQMPCQWDSTELECVEFEFDCENFATQIECETSSFREMSCIWTGECDFAVQLESPTPKQAMSIHDLQTAPKALLGLFFVTVVAGSCCIVFGSCCMCRKRSKESEEFYEVFDLEMDAEQGYSCRSHHTDGQDMQFGYPVNHDAHAQYSPRQHQQAQYSPRQQQVHAPYSPRQHEDAHAQFSPRKQSAAGPSPTSRGGEYLPPHCPHNDDRLAVPYSPAPPTDTSYRNSPPPAQERYSNSKIHMPYDRLKEHETRYSSPRDQETDYSTQEEDSYCDDAESDTSCCYSRERDEDSPDMRDIYQSFPYSAQLDRGPVYSEEGPVYPCDVKRPSKRFSQRDAVILRTPRRSVQ